jgi:4-amino-4-deoxy-L-arabinose transferase-like glycosyltransferase
MMIPILEHTGTNQKNMSFVTSNREYILRFAIALIFIYALYLLVITTTKFQGWGGDYAGYMDQARSIVESRDTKNPNYIYNPEVPTLAPPSYPMGFALLLSPIYHFFGTDTLIYVKFMSVLWWLCGVSLFFFLYKKFSLIPSAIASMLFLFNPHYFIEKNGILPDSFFAICILWALYFYMYAKASNKKSAIFCGFLTGFAILTRVNGVALLLAMILSFALEFFIKKYKKEKIEPDLADFKQLTLIVLTALVVIIGVKLWLPGPVGGSYFDQLKFDKDFLSKSQEHFKLYYKTILHFFGLPPKMDYMYELEYHNKTTSIIGYLSIFFIFLELVFIRKREDRVLLLFLLISTTVLTIWPMVQGYRYVLPMLPIYIYFLFCGIQKIKIPPLKTLVCLLFPIILSPVYWNINQTVAGHNMNEEAGAPEYPNNQEAYDYVRKNYPKSAIFAYHHPLIFGFYADRKSVKWDRDNTPEQILHCLQKYKVQYILVNDWLLDSDKNFKEFLKQYAYKLEKQWNNERNTVYLLK